jgi:hypothetical protein
MWVRNPNLVSSFEKIADGDYKLKDAATGASFFIDEGKREQHYEELGVTLDDNRPQIDFFVMSYCPYGNQAEEAIAPVFTKLGEHADFNPRYVIYSNYRGGGPTYCLDEEDLYCSMHGIQELNQNLREACVNEEYGMQEWFDFALAANAECTYQNVDQCWTGVAEDLDLDTEKIQDCFDERAEEIAAEELRLTQAYSVTGSPTVFIDGEKYSGSRTAAGFAAALCAAFDEAPEECEDLSDLEGQSAQATPTGQC